MQDILQNGLPEIALWIIGALLAIYCAVALLLNLPSIKLFRQNLQLSNRVNLPKIAQKGKVPASGAGNEEQETLLLVPLPDRVGPAERGGLIYPAQGRNGLSFKPADCTSCGLCVYVCPAGAVSTTPTEKGYSRNFDFGRCVYCGLCESACPTQAILLTVEQPGGEKQTIISGAVNWEKCSRCGAKPPRHDLLAGEIYNLDGTVAKSVQKESACPECLRRVQAVKEASV